MSYDSITNHGDYLSPYYLAEVLPRELKAKDGLRARWAERDKAGELTPVKGLRGCGASTSAPGRRSRNSPSYSPMILTPLMKLAAVATKRLLSSKTTVCSSPWVTRPAPGCST